MSHFIRLTPGDLQLAPETRLLKAADYQTFLTARALLDEAQRQSETLRAAAAQEYERQRERGYAEGLDEARLEMAGRMLETSERILDYLAGVEDQVVTLVMTAVRKILGEFEDGELTRRVVRNALSMVRNQPRATIRVHAAQVAALNQHLHDLLAGYSSLGQVEIIADPRLEPGGCILETEIGVVEASLEVQLRALERALRSRLQRSAS